MCPGQRDNTCPTLGPRHPVLSRDPEGGCHRHHHHPQHMISNINRKNVPTPAQHKPPRVSRSKPSPCTQPEHKGLGTPCPGPAPALVPPSASQPRQWGLPLLTRRAERTLCKYHSPDSCPQRGSPEVAGPALGHPLNTGPCPAGEGAAGRGDTGEQRNPQSPWARGDVSAPLPPSTKVLRGWRKHGTEGGGVRWWGESGVPALNPGAVPPAQVMCPGASVWLTSPQELLQGRGLRALLMTPCVTAGKRRLRVAGRREQVELRVL